MTILLNRNGAKNCLNLLSAALLIIDMQNDFLLEDAPICCTNGLGIVVEIEKVTRYFRANNKPIIFTGEIRNI